jgi:biopolymer transport protein ExbD
MAFGGGGYDEHRSSAFGGVFGKESATSYEVYLNLTPLMDVMSNILFFLLAAFGATLVAVLPTSIPTRGDPSENASAQEEKVTITVRADAQGLTLALDSPHVDPSVLKPFSGRFGRTDKGYDFASFTQAVKRIKEKWPESRTMVLVPDDGFRFEQIVKVMDAAREYRPPPKECEAKGRSAGCKMTLFDETVLSSTPASEKVK